LPALDELAERLRRKQHRRVAQIAVLVDVDQPPAQRVVVQLEGRLRGAQLDRIPIQFPLRRTFLDVQIADVRLHLSDRRRRLGQLRLQSLHAHGRRAEFGFLRVQLGVKRGGLAALLFDALLQRRRLGVRGVRHDERKRGEYGENRAKLHVRRLSFT
jgi:hypothetical protein